MFAPTATPSASPGRVSPTVSPTLTPGPSPTPDVLDSKQLIFTEATGGSRESPVGSTVEVRARNGWDGKAEVATWRLDEGDVGQATLAPTPDGLVCHVTLRRPGLVRIIATRGRAISYMDLLAVADPAPGELLPWDLEYPGSRLPDGVGHRQVLIDGTTAWRSFWMEIAQDQGVVWTDQDVPPFPRTDFKASTLLLLVGGFPVPQYDPVLLDVANGQVEVGVAVEFPVLSQPQVTSGYAQLYRLPKQPPGTRVVVDRRCPGCEAPADTTHSSAATPWWGATSP